MTTYPHLDKRIKISEELKVHGPGRTVYFQGEGWKGPSKVEGVLFLTLFGSHLHGTATAQSDRDYKGIYMADLPSIVLGEDKATIQVSTGGEDRNSPDDIDVEFIEVRKFLKDGLAGQTYAVELLHPGEHAEVFRTALFEEILLHREKLLSKNTRPFLGYCVSQAKKYGLKGARLRGTEEALDFLKRAQKRSEKKILRVEDIAAEIPKNEVVQLVEKHLDGQEEPILLLEINNKQFDGSLKLPQVIATVEKVVDRYGARSRKARDGVDWKAIGHAYRTLFELREYLTTGKIQFPLEQREALLAIKQGQRSFEEIQEELPLLLEQVEELDTDLPEKGDQAFWQRWIVDVYLHHKRGGAEKENEGL